MRIELPKQAFVLEDDFEISNLLTLILGNYNLQVFTSSTISEAREQLKGIYPAIMIIDHKLPDGFGFNFVSELRVSFPESYIIAMTANRTLDNIELSYVSGADKFIEKPFDVNNMDALIRGAL